MGFSHLPLALIIKVWCCPANWIRRMAVCRLCQTNIQHLWCYESNDRHLAFCKSCRCWQHLKGGKCCNKWICLLCPAALCLAWAVTLQFLFIDCPNMATCAEVCNDFHKQYQRFVYIMPTVTSDWQAGHIGMSFTTMRPPVVEQKWVPLKFWVSQNTRVRRQD